MKKNLFWDRVKMHLKACKKTQKMLASHINMPLRTLEFWIYKGLYPTIADGYVIAKFLGVSIEYLLTGKENISETKVNSIRKMLKQAEERLGKI